MRPSALILTLREATRPWHHRLDHHALLAPLVHADLTLDAYGAALAALHGVQAGGERAITAALARLAACRTLGADSENGPRRAHFLPDSPPHSRSMGQEAGEKGAVAVGLQPVIPKSDRLLGLAYADQPRLADLEADLAALGRSPWPCVAAPVVTEVADLIGLLYVFEGSRLGARVIARQIAQTLPDAPRRFFAGDPERWVTFQAFADAHCPPPAHPRAAAAAQAQFERTLAHLDACLAHGVAP